MLRHQKQMHERASQACPPPPPPPQRVHLGAPPPPQRVHLGAPPPPPQGSHLGVQGAPPPPHGAQLGIQGAHLGGHLGAHGAKFVHAEAHVTASVPAPSPPPSPQKENMVFLHPFTMMISGPTACGKTTMVKELLQYHSSKIQPGIQRIVWLYKR